MASQLHEAVRLAQAGQREEARRLLWQVVQTEPKPRDRLAVAGVGLPPICPSTSAR